MADPADALIVGGGLNGPALALALAGAGLSAAVIDAQPPRARAGAGFDGRAYALSAASQRLLAAVGVWDALAPAAQPILRVLAADGRAGEGVARFFLHFDAAETEDGPMGYMVEDRHLYAALCDGMERAGVRHLQAATVVAQEAGEALATVTLADGRWLQGRAILGCDGRDSGTGRRAGIGRTVRGYGQRAVVCAIDHDRPHGSVAQQVFLPTGPLALLPLTGNRSSVVWSETGANAETLLVADDASFTALLAERVGGALGGFRLAGRRFGYPLSLSLAERYVAHRVALAGDAAHGVHPVAGQGLNLGFRDVGALAEVMVTAARRGEDIGAADVLARYERWRRPEATAMALGMDAMTRLFSSDNAALRAARVAGMGLVSALPALRRTFIRTASGLTGEVPQLLRGLRP
ncbi:MAG: FAD-dependent monooxygenase [Paracoccaceae bacterium]